MTALILALANTGRSCGRAPLLVLRTTRLPQLAASGMCHTWRRMLGLAYRLYEVRLARQVRRRPPPRHIGIILDGNRRYGQAEGISDPQDVYELGARKLDDVLDWCAELAIPAVTLWVLSADNLRRAQAEVSGILAALEGKLRSLARDPQIHSRRVRVRAIGRLELIPASVLAAVDAAREATATHGGMSLTIAVAYDGREEIVYAVHGLLAEQARKGASLAEAAEQVSTAAISRHLYTAGGPDPDLIIRTSGEIRLSGFLLWQSAYSEYYFTDVYWPAFRKIDFLRAIRAYQQRNRRFGL
jgi:short-chain Z-isoprenyl diphosphate synthase